MFLNCFQPGCPLALHSNWLCSWDWTSAWTCLEELGPPLHRPHRRSGPRYVSSFRPLRWGLLLEKGDFQGLIRLVDLCYSAHVPVVGRELGGFGLIRWWSWRRLQWCCFLSLGCIWLFPPHTTHVRSQTCLTVAAGISERWPRWTFLQPHGPLWPWILASGANLLSLPLFADIHQWRRKINIIFFILQAEDCTRHPGKDIVRIFNGHLSGFPSAISHSLDSSS